MDDIEAAEVRRSHPLPQGRMLEVVDSWTAVASLTLTIKERSGLAPGATFINPLRPNNPNQLFTFGLGLNAASEATRRHIEVWSINFSSFTSPVSLAAALERRQRERRQREGSAPPADAAGTGGFVDNCSVENASPIQGDTDFRGTLNTGLFAANISTLNVAGFIRSLQAIKNKDVLVHDVTFVTEFGGSVTPAWKLVRFTANQSGTFLSASRIDTHNLVIAMGPPPATSARAVPPEEQRPAVSAAVQNAVLASQIGQAVYGALRGVQ